MLDKGNWYEGFLGLILCDLMFRLKAMVDNILSKLASPTLVSDMKEFIDGGKSHCSGNELKLASFSALVMGESVSLVVSRQVIADIVTRLGNTKGISDEATKEIAHHLLNMIQPR